ncbi:antitoxin [Archaeoglobales archaeon]|nr:MAG: antitoxin [Archaeoglobales archaeon]
MKNIMVRDEVYEKLQKMKKGKESFSDVILRLIEEKKMKGIEVLERYAGKLESEELERIVMEERKKFRVRNFDI